MRGMLGWIYLFILSAAAWQFPFQTMEQSEVAVGEQQVPEAETESEGMRCMDTFTLVKQYALNLDKEWELDGKTPEWSPSTSGRPLHWGKERRRMDPPAPERAPGEDGFGSDAAVMEVSHDGKLMALATGMIIRVYDMANQKLRAELVGHLGSVSEMSFAPKVSSNQPKAQYMLLSQGGTGSGRFSQDHTVITWYLNAEGKALNLKKPFEVETLADKAISAVSQDLAPHELSEKAIDDLRKDFLTSLKTADTKNHQRDLPSFQGTFPHFGSESVSKDGSRILHVFHNESTQSGQRDTEMLPQIAVRSLANPTGDPISILQGYRDAIMWASFSPTNPDIIASACWDGSYRIWDTSTSPATCLHHIKIKKSPQNWSGAFSPDGEHVLLSGTNNVAIYSITTGEEVFSLSSKRKLEPWVRAISWNPKDPNAVALVSGTEVLLWEPFDPEEPNKCTAVVSLVLEKDRIMQHFGEFRTVRWLNEDVLAAKAAEDSWLLWDRKMGLKWRFMRPKGMEAELYTADCALVEEGGKRVFVALDGDRKVREWVLD